MERILTPTKRVALVAHDARKDEMVDWARCHRAVLERQVLMATGTTGHRLVDELGLEVECLRSGPFGGDQQIGCRIAEGRLDALVFLWDPLEAQPHEPDVRALLRIAVVWNIPVACNRATADLLVASPLFTDATAPVQPAA
ncbi:MAG: methylglyoxal synthase [Actinomycetota bacterium]